MIDTTMEVNMCSDVLYRKRLLPQILDDIATRTPDRVFACVPYSPALEDGLKDVTFGELASSVHFFCTWLSGRIVKAHDFEALCYIGVQDLRSATIFLAAVRLGYKVLLLSPRNTTKTNLSLMQQIQCTKFLYAAEISPLADNMTALKADLECIEVPTFAEMLLEPGKPVPYDFSFEEAENHPIAVLHSSGSTGPPKPIIMTNGSFSVLDNEATIPTVDGRKNRNFSMWNELNGGKYYTAFPYCHLAGFVSIIVQPLMTNSVPVLGPPLAPPSSSILAEILTYNPIQAIFVPPSIAEQLLHDDHGLFYFAPLVFVCYIGGPLSSAAGNTINSVTSVRQFYGSTEVFMIPQLEPLDSKEWEYFEWHPAAEIKMEYSSAAGVREAHELVVSGGPGTRRRTALSHNLPGVESFRTKDIFTPHPYKKDLWKYSSRTDDIIVFSNGEKVNPVPMELAVQSHHSLQGALVVGNGKAKAVLIVEPNEETRAKDPNEIVEGIWSAVEQVNRTTPRQGQVSKQRILVASEEKPFRRAGKGTVMRRMTENDYVEEIDMVLRLGPLNFRL